MRRTIDWDGEVITIIDQTALPGEYRVLTLHTVDALIEAIQRLAVRGAPALGVAGVLGVALSAQAHPNDPDAVRAEAERLATARPTAANLSWGVQHALDHFADSADAVSTLAHQVLSADERNNRLLCERAAEVIIEQCGSRPLRALTICNSGALAAVHWGTGLGAIRALAEQGVIEEVLSCETRPLLQGARLTVWELAQLGIPHRLCVDSAGPAAISRGLVDCVVVGADRITANGDVANKIGTYALACAAAQADIPFVVVAPDETIDPTLPDGTRIPIEDRPAEEVRSVGGLLTTLPKTPVFNPAFDITPISLITAVVTTGTIFTGRAVTRDGSPTKSLATAHLDTLRFRQNRERAVVLPHALLSSR